MLKNIEIIPTANPVLAKLNAIEIVPDPKQLFNKFNIISILVCLEIISISYLFISWFIDS